MVGIMSNFETATNEYQEYAELAATAESLIYSSVRSSLTIFGTFAEQLTKKIFHLDGLVDYELNQKERIDKMNRSGNEYPASVLKALDELRRYRNKATHSEDYQPTTKAALNADKAAYLVWSWFLQVFSQDELRQYVEPVDRQQVLADQEAKIKSLEAKIASLQEAEQKPIKVTQEQRQERRKINVAFAKKHELTEDETRELIDQQLRDAGWIADSKTIRYTTQKPEAGKNYAIAEWELNGQKRADYALFIGLRLVGFVEAKKWNEDIAGHLSQAKEYSRLSLTDKDLAELKNAELELVSADMGNYMAPFIYSANGRPYIKQYEQKSGIWFWDARNEFEPSKALENFHSPEDLALKLKAVSKQQADKSLMEDQAFPKFAGRDYQVQAIKNIERAIEEGKNRILLEMATGTGKTRTALSLMYRLIKHKRARRILYLVDRNSLGRQTANAINDNKIGPHSLADIYPTKEIDDKIPDTSTKIQIATVQGMIRRLFVEDDVKNKPSVGMYDFIIVDEAHRGYTEDREMSDGEYENYYQEDYVSQYRHVVDYFDATAIGMTATPALQTIQIFGNPVFSYSYQQAVLDGYLVDHNAPKIIKTELSQAGIHFKKDSQVNLFNQDTKEIEVESLPDNMDFDLRDFNSRVITQSFNEVVCDYLAENLDPNDPSMGKTLIFAANDSHADMVVDLLKKAFIKAGNPVPEDAIEKITGYLRHPNEEIRRYKNEQLPNIAVTVDLLTTGIDVPEISNLVFLRQVKSRILYEQMLGRATRLCPDIHKDHFEIYDAVGIYDAMNKVTNMKPVVKNPKHDVKYFVDHQHEYFEICEDSMPYQIDMAAAVERKIKRLDDKSKKEFERNTNTSSIEEWASSLSELSKADFMQEFNKFKFLTQLHSVHEKQYISDVEDHLLSVERGYGDSNQKPEDYIESFNRFVQNNLNEIPALNIIATRPKELTLKELKEIRKILSENSYSVNQLCDAWKSANSVQTTADIISFIRQAALGTPLVDHEVRIHNAMQRVYGMADWNTVQTKWLKKIENQLIKQDVLGPTAQEAFDDNLFFKRNGGYKQMNRVFNEHADDIIKILNENLYA